MNRFFSAMNKYPITITNNAWNKMTEIITKQNANSFLFSATSGGCNGFNYELTLIDKMKYNNIYNTNKGKIKPTLMVKDDTKLLIDPMAEMLLLGTTIDYISEDFPNGVFENKFIFIPYQFFKYMIYLSIID